MTSFYNVQSSPSDAFEHVVFTGSANQSYVLGDAYTTPGAHRILKNVGTGTITITTYNGQTIDGAATLLLTGQYSYVTLFSNGGNWFVLDNENPNSVLASTNLVAQTASIAAATLYAVPATAPGLYRVTVDLVATTAGSAGTVLTTIAGNNGSAGTSQSTSAMSLTTLGTESSATFLVNSAGGQNITYATTVASATGSPQYAASYRVEYLG